MVEFISVQETLFNYWFINYYQKKRGKFTVQNNNFAWENSTTMPGKESYRNFKIKQYG